MKTKKTKVKALILLVTAMLLTVSCGQEKKSPALLMVTPDKIDVYLNGFKRYFDIVNKASDAGKWIAIQRYTIIVNRDKPESQNGCFLINILDDGSNNVHVDFAYTVGAQTEDATVVNPNMLSGHISVSKGINLVLNESDATLRAQKIAAAIYQTLVEIEGK